MEAEATETVIHAWDWLGRELLEFGLRWLVLALVSGGIAVLGVLLFGRGYKKRIAALEAQASTPAITQTINFRGTSAADERERHLRNAVGTATVQGLKETIRSLPQHPLGDGHTYANLPDGTNIVSMADGSYRLALPVRLSTAFKGELIGSVGGTTVSGSVEIDPPADDDGRAE